MGAQSRRIRGELEAYVGRVTAAVVLGVHARLVSPPPVGTPRDTSFTAANWVPSVGAPFEGTAGTREAAERGSIDRGAATRGLAELARYSIKRGPAFLSNNADPPISQLNDGSSAQTPAGFVQRAAEDGVRDVASNPPPAP